MRAWIALCLVMLMLVACQSPQEPTPMPIWLAQATATPTPLSAPVGGESPAPAEPSIPTQPPASTQPSALAPTSAPASPTPTPGPVIRLVPPHSPAPTAAAIPEDQCGSGPPPSSLDQLPSQSTTVYEGKTYYLVGRDLVVDFQLVGSLGFRMVRVMDSPTCWGCGAKNPNKFGSPIRPPCKLPETRILEAGRNVQCNRLYRK
jgi:hypothetical protein